MAPLPPAAKQQKTRWLAHLDIYRKVPTDLLETSAEGNIFSWFVLICIITLLFRETLEFLSPKLVADLAIDAKRTVKDDHKMQVNFNITMLDLKCQHATINVVSVLGNEQNITKNIQRWDLDSVGIARQLSHRNPDQHDIVHYDESVYESIEHLHANGEDAASLDEESLGYALEEYEYVFVNFFASWCSHCQKLHPTWERFAEIMHDAENNNKPPDNIEELSEEEIMEAMLSGKKHPVLIAKVDCVQHAELCANERIMAYPELILFVNGGRALGGSYHGDRTIKAFFQALISVEHRVNRDDNAVRAIEEHAHAALERHFNMTKDHADWVAAMARSKENHRILWNEEEHPGCVITGTLHLNRVPGRFYIQASGEAAGHDFDPYKTNMSHEINQLSFQQNSGDTTGSYKREVVPPNYDKLTRPFDGNIYANEELHEAFHHYIKLVPTNTQHYQVVQNSQLAIYHEMIIPEAKFQLDFSPIALHYRIKRRPWYDYATSLLAIVGGTFTIVGILESLARVTHKKVAARKSIRKGPQQANPTLHYEQPKPMASVTSYH